jgi:tetratricopeptide (TPR) repeat protein
VASIYGLQSRWKEAEELQTSLLELSFRVLGEKHPETLIVTVNLARAYWEQGRIKEAEELQAQALEIFSRVLGEKHPDTQICKSNLAAYKDYGRRQEAKKHVLPVKDTAELPAEERRNKLTSKVKLVYRTWRNKLAVRK